MQDRILEIVVYLMNQLSEEQGSLNSIDDMSWVPTNHRYEMFMSIRVPSLTKAYVQQLFEPLFMNVGLDFDREKPDAIFAIHPGGPKIIDMIQEELDLTERQIENSRKVLFENGNISSATSPAIWDSIVRDDSIPSGKLVVCVAFGPGLTATAALMKKV